jgi:hypothetical protein
MIEMKIIRLVALAVAVFILAAAPAALAKGKKDKTPQTVQSEVFAKYDKNYNGVLDADEKDALRKDFDADKTGPLKVWDTNKDGKLSDDEIAAIPSTKTADAPAKKGKKNK